MYQHQESQIVQYVNTFTTGEWQGRRHNQRMRKGITRVTKSTSQSAEKFAHFKHKRVVQEHFNDENQNLSNRNKLQNPDIASPIYLLERIKQLQLELTVFQKQKLQLQRKLNKENGQHNIMHFVESHYIACKQDVEQLMSEKQRMQQAINNFEIQNNQLRFGMGLQQQYIIKVQEQLNHLRAQPLALLKLESNQQSTQTQTQNQRIVYKQAKPQLVSIQSQCQNYEVNQYQQLTKLALKFQEQTNEFSAFISKLEEQNFVLNQENNRLNKQLNEICELCKQSQLINEKQNHEWNERLIKIEKQNEQKIQLKSHLLEQQIKRNFALNQDINRFSNQLNKRGSLNIQNQFKNQKQNAEQNEKVIKMEKYYQQKIKQKSNMLDQQNKRKIKNLQELVNTKNIQIEQLSNKLKKTPTINKQVIQLKQEIRQLQLNYQTSISQLKNAQNSERLAKDHLLSAEAQNMTLKNMKEELLAYEESFKSLKVKNTMLNQELISLRRQIEKLRQQQPIQEKAYFNIKQQFDSLLIFLEQKNEQLKQKQLKISQQIQNQQIIYMKNQQTLRKQTQIEAIISHYQNQIKRIQVSLQSYISLLTAKSDEKQTEIKQIRARYQIQQNSNNQEKLYLLNKIDSLQQELNLSKHENKQATRNFYSQSNKIQQKQCIISRLRADIMELSKKYERQISLKSQLTKQNVQISKKMIQQQTINTEVRRQLQNIKKHYDSQILLMQNKIDYFQKSLRLLEVQNSEGKKAFQLRLIEVKKDYDVLYAKYLKYKTLSIHLQAEKPKKH